MKLNKYENGWGVVVFIDEIFNFKKILKFGPDPVQTPFNARPGRPGTINARAGPDPGLSLGATASLGPSHTGKWRCLTRQARAGLQLQPCLASLVILL